MYMHMYNTDPLKKSKKVMNFASPVINFVVLHVPMNSNNIGKYSFDFFFSSTLSHASPVSAKHLNRHNRNAKGGSRDFDYLSGSRRLVPNLSPMHPLSSKKKTSTP